MEEKNKKSIGEIFAEGTLVDKALQQGVREALLRHKQLGYPIVIWRGGKIVWVKAEDIQIST